MAKKRIAVELAMWRRLFYFTRDVIELCGSRSLYALVLLVVGGVSEGFSLLMLLPLMQVLAHQSGSNPGLFTEISLDQYLGLSVSFNLWAILVAFVCFVTANAFISQYKTVYINRVTVDAVDRLRLDLFKSILAARWERIAKLRKADLDHILTGDIDRVTASILGIFLLAQNFILLIAYLVLSFLISVEMTLFSMLAGLLVFIFMAPVRRRALNYSRELTTAMQMQYRTVGDFLGGLKTTKSFNSEDRYSSALAEHLSKMNTGKIQFVILTAKSNFLFQLSTVVTACFFVFAAIGYFEMEISRVLVLLLVFMRLVPRLSSSQAYMQGVLSNISSFEEIRAVGELCNGAKETAPATPNQPFDLASYLTLEGVRYSYDEHPAIDNMNIILASGTITAITGPSGSGKSTLADILLGLILPSTGFMSVDGVRLTEYNLRSWRQRVSYVPQDSYLLSTSIAENLRVARPEATDKQIWESLRAANAETFVQALPMGLHTTVGDGGRAFSGGERQRIALARALLRKPALLILDEPTSALDDDNTHRFISAISELRGKMTVVVITHNPLVADIADMTIVLSGGQANVVTRPAVRSN